MYMDRYVNSVAYGFYGILRLLHKVKKSIYLHKMLMEYKLVYA